MSKKIHMDYSAFQKQNKGMDNLHLHKSLKWPEF